MGKNNRLTAMIAGLLFLVIPGSIYGESTQFATETLIQGLDHPWSIVFLPGHRGISGEAGLLISERPGRLLLYENGRIVEVNGTPQVAAVGQGGLLDLALSPDFASDSLLYMSYAEEGPGGYSTAVARGRLTADRRRLEDLEVIYRVLPRSSGGLHFGSRLLFDSRGYLYVTLGERGDRTRARDTSDPAGSVLRLNPDGSIPDTNPFAASGDKSGKGLPEIWTWGHRNPQGIALHPESGEVWIHEHGPKGGDEINILTGGGDYGWPALTYGINYNGSIISNRQSAAGYVDPLLYWTPSIAPSGMTFYQGDAFPAWKGNLFVGALAAQQLRRIEFRGGEVFNQDILLQGVLGRIRDVRSGPDGYIYLLTDSENGGLYRLVPVP